MKKLPLVGNLQIIHWIIKYPFIQVHFSHSYIEYNLIYKNVSTWHWTFWSKHIRYPKKYPSGLPACHLASVSQAINPPSDPKHVWPNPSGPLHCSQVSFSSLFLSSTAVSLPNQATSQLGLRSAVYAAIHKNSPSNKEKKKRNKTKLKTNQL